MKNRKKIRLVRKKLKYKIIFIYSDYLHKKDCINRALEINDQTTKIGIIKSLCNNKETSADLSKLEAKLGKNYEIYKSREKTFYTFDTRIYEIDLRNYLKL